MSSESKKYTWQEIQVSPHSFDEINAQIDFLQKLLDCDPHCLVIDIEERQAIYSELSRLSNMLTVTFNEEMDKRLEVVKKRSSRHTSSFWKKAHETSRIFLGPLWLIFIAVLLSFPIMSSLSDDLPWILPVWTFMFCFYLVWAVWASCSLEE